MATPAHPPRSSGSPQPGGGSDLSAEHVRRIARLARLALPDDQVESYRASLGAVLAYERRLSALDLSGVEPLASPLDATARMEPDDPGPTLPTEVLMRMAPETMPPFIKVPKVLGDGGAA